MCVCVYVCVSMYMYVHMHVRTCTKCVYNRCTCMVNGSSDKCDLGTTMHMQACEHIIMCV